jgi:Prokaryotic membrane lipoprotein lipid attachment site
MRKLFILIVLMLILSACQKVEADPIHLSPVSDHIFQSNFNSDDDEFESIRNNTGFIIQRFEELPTKPGELTYNYHYVLDQFIEFNPNTDQLVLSKVDDNEVSLAIIAKDSIQTGSFQNNDWIMSSSNRTKVHLTYFYFTDEIPTIFIEPRKVDLFQLDFGEIKVLNQYKNLKVDEEIIWKIGEQIKLSTFIEFY